MPGPPETNSGSTDSQGSTARWESETIFFPSLPGGERAPTVPHFLALGQVWMEAKPQSKFELTSSAQGLSHQVPLEILTIWKGPQLEGG